MEGGQRGNRSVSFQKLKPVCVTLSKITISGQGKSPPGLQEALDTVYHALQEIDFLDPELANYVFFPLARVFGAVASVPARALETSLKCLRILISHGWSKSSDASLCKQLLILLSFITDPSAIPGKEQSQHSDIVIIAALDCLFALCQDSSSLILALCRSKDDRPLPVLGQIFSALLTTLKNDIGPEVDVRASRTLKTLVSCVQEEALLLNFLPGIVSALTRYASPRRNARTPARSLVNAIDTLKTTLYTAFASVAIQDEGAENSDDGSPGTQKWREAQAVQVTKALSQLVHLRYHESEKVHAALFSFCVTLLRDCQPALWESVKFLLSTSVYICGSDIASSSELLSSLYAVITPNPALVNELDQLLQEWLTALPRLALEGDGDKLQKQSSMLVAGYRCASQYSTNSAHLSDMVLRGLQDSVAVALPTASLDKDLLVEESGPTSKAMTLTLLRESLPEFKALGHTIKGGAETLEILQGTLSALTEDATFRDYAFQSLAASTASYNEGLLSSLWLARQIFGRHSTEAADMGQFLVDFNNDSEERLDEMDAVYSQAVDVLTNFNDAIRTDWRLQAISLELVAAMAQQQGSAFQSELVDVLFPVIEKIGSPQTEVRERALSCLNILATACGANSAGDLIIQNADYLVNSMALRLNAFEVSAQAPRVMVMVIHLCGPSLIPFLDDILESIFSALSSFHGYPRLVDALFSILEAIVDQGSSPSSKLLEAPAQQHKASRISIIPVIQVADELKNLKGLGNETNENIEPAQIDPTSDGSEEHEREEAQEQHEQKIEPSRTYQMVQSITRYSQYYLTHSSPALRQRLLKLLSTASSSLSRNENAYLPLVNDVWPVAVTRLYDSEAAVCMEAMESLNMLFQSAGDFLVSRVQTEWPRIIGLGKRIRAQADAESHGKSGRGSFSMTYQLLEKYIAMLHGLVMHVGISEAAEDDIFGLLASLYDKASVRQLLEEVNADTYWLVAARAKKHGILMHNTKPLASGFQFHELIL